MPDENPFGVLGGNEEESQESADIESAAVDQARLEAQRRKLRKKRGEKNEETSSPDLAEARGVNKIESFNQRLEKAVKNMDSADRVQSGKQQDMFLDAAKRDLEEAQKIIETAPDAEIPKSEKEKLYEKLAEVAQRIGQKDADIEEKLLYQKHEGKLSVNNLMLEHKESAERVDDLKQQIHLLELSKKAGETIDSDRLASLQDSLREEEGRLASNKLGRLFYDIETSIKSQITQKADLPLPTKLKYIGYIKEDIAEIKKVLKKLPEADALVVSERLKQVEDIFNQEAIARQKEADLRTKEGKKKEDDKVEKASDKKEVQQKQKPKKVVTTPEIRSNEVAVIFADINSKLYNDSLDLRDISNLKNKLLELQNSIEGNTVIDNFSNSPINTEEKDRILQRINSTIEKIDTKAQEAFEADLTFVREANNPNHLIGAKINSIERYLNETKTTNQELRNELKQIKDRVNHTKGIVKKIHHVMDLSVLSDNEIVEKLEQDKGDLAEKIGAELAQIDNLIEVVEKSKSDFEISFGSKDIDNELTVEERRKETLDFLAGFKSRLGKLYDTHIATKEGKDVFSKTLSFKDIEGVLNGIDAQRVGGYTKEEILNSISEITQKDSDDVLLKLAHAGYDYQKDLRIGRIPTAYGLRDAVVRILNQRLEPFTEAIQKEEEQRQKEKKEEQRKNRGILTKGNLTRLEFTTIDHALSEPGFTDFLVLQDKYFGGNSSEKAVAEDNVEYIKAQYEIYVSAREVSKALKGVLDTEVERDFGGRIKIPDVAFANINDYILDIAVKSPDYLQEMREVVSHSIEIPKKVETLEKDLAAAYSMFNNIEGLEKAEQEVINKEKLLAEIKASTGQDKEELIKQFKRNKSVDISWMERLPFRHGPNVLKKGLDFAERSYEKANYSLDRFNHYAYNLENPRSQDDLLETITAINRDLYKPSRHTSPWELDSEQDTHGPTDNRILDRDNIDALMQASTTAERHKVVQEIKNKFIIQKAEYSNLARKTREAIQSEELGFFKKSDLVDSLIEEGLIDPEIGTIKKTLRADSSIRSAAKKLEAQIEEDKEKIRLVKEKMSGIEEQKAELQRLYVYSTRRLFKGISAVDETRQNIENFVRDELFKDSEDVDVDEEVAKKVNELKKGKKESYEDFLVRKEQYEKDVREKITTEILEKAEKDLGSLQALKDKVQGKEVVPGSIENIDQSNRMTYVRTPDIEKAESKISARIRDGLKLKIDDILSRLDQKEDITLTDIERQIILWTHRPPTVKWTGEKKFQNMVVTHAHRDAIKGRESEKIILEILKEKKSKMNAVADAPKRILLTRIISNLENK